MLRSDEGAMDEAFTPVPIIFDTDFGGDAVLHALADLGECEILSVMEVNGYRYR